METLEKLASDIEFAQVEAQVVNGLKVGNEALKKVNEMLSIEEVEQIMDETRESIEKQNEIDALLHGVLDEEDEEAVMNELDDLIAEESIGNKENIKFADEDINVLLPDVPEHELKKEKESEEKWLKNFPVNKALLITKFSFSRSQRTPAEGRFGSLKCGFKYIKMLENLFFKTSFLHVNVYFWFSTI